MGKNEIIGIDKVENARSKALEREKYHSKRYPHMKKYGKHIKP